MHVGEALSASCIQVAPLGVSSEVAVAQLSSSSILSSSKTARRYKQQVSTTVEALSTNYYKEN